MYSSMSWQGSQAYNSSAKSAHEAKMGSVLAGFRGLPQGLFLLVPVLIYVFMNHPSCKILPTLSIYLYLSWIRIRFVHKCEVYCLINNSTHGATRCICGSLLAAFVSTHDTYLHSWATIIIQDVVMPFRNKPFDKDTLIKVLRYAIFGVASSYSLLVYIPAESEMALFFAITAAIFAGGSGAVIIGGLYWKRGYYCRMDPMIIKHYQCWGRSGETNIID